MPATVEQVCNDALLSVASNAGLLTASRFLALRYQKLASRVRFKHLRRRVELILPKQENTGTATFTLDSDLVTGDADALAAWVELGGVALRGRFIRANEGGSGSQPWLEIAGLESEGLRLATPFSQSTVSAGGYRIVARYHRLIDGIRWLGPITLPRLNCRLVPASESELSYFSAGRFVTGTGYPSRFSMAPPDFDGRQRIEVYPPPNQQDEVANYVCHVEPKREWKPTDVLPAGLSEDVLREGIILDLLRLKWAKAVDEKDYEGAAHYRNEYNSSMTRWERDGVAEAGDIDSTVSDDFIMLRDQGEPTGDDWLRSGLEDGLWPADRL